ncbi:hypothetical protein [Phytoactinopolyspora halotolerans]|uniref:Uncharacterized protein n=1 Tax=Phytoactinopolyspora halotolerans TaxID=1981512 RepID=A0A6L9S4U8_9ACTN|nr:hypothetical protein [Phytoactinopolyspora halotolerans]NEE00159.1 hypothetical protein [Phytoactinopolyspora halotolerans]
MDIAVQELRDLIRRDHERTIAEYQAFADEAAIIGDEKGRAWYQKLADRGRQTKYPWEEGYRWRSTDE